MVTSPGAAFGGLALSADTVWLAPDWLATPELHGPTQQLSPLQHVDAVGFLDVFGDGAEAAKGLEQHLTFWPPRDAMAFLASERASSAPLWTPAVGAELNWPDSVGRLHRRPRTTRN